jgi:hypothetical protein
MWELGIRQEKNRKKSKRPLARALSPIPLLTIAQQR